MKSTLIIFLAAFLTILGGRLVGRLEAAPERSPIVYGLNGFSFDPGSGISNRFLTPNGDGLNDFVVFTFENPRDSEIAGSIYDLKGRRIATLSAGPAPASPAQSTLLWDGKAGGQAVAGGVYIYVVLSEETVVSGTVVVVR